MIVVYQRLTFGKSARSTSWRSWRQAQPSIAKSAIEMFATDEFGLTEPLVEDTIKPAGLLRIAFQAVAPVLLVFDLQKMMHLPGHRAKAAHLPHQPLQHRHLPPQIARPEFAGLFPEIDQYRP